MNMFGFWNRYRLQRQMRRQAAMQRPSIGASQGWLRPFSWILRIPAALVNSVGWSLRTLIASMAAGKRNWRNLALGLPAVLLLVGFAAATAVGYSRQQSNGLLYWRAGEQALAKGEAETALLYLQKALTVGGMNSRDVLFALARAYEETKQFDRADVLMSSLAGIGTEGLPQAHRYLAIRTAAKVSETRSIDDLEAWHWHLTHADQVNSSSLQKAWGMYYLIGGDLENSIKHYKVAAEEEPAMWLQVAELQARQNDMDAVRVTLATARQRLEQQFLRDPGNSQNRLLYATSLFYIGELPDAEMLLKEGLASEDNASFRQLLAAVFIRMYDVEIESERGVEGAFRYLKLALDYEPNYRPALTRLVTFARSSPERMEEGRAAMRKLISAGNTSAMAHFTLSTLEWIAGNQQLALLNMKQAVELDPKMPVIANNLAFLMAQEETPDLEAALSLASQAIEADETNPDFRDTRGDIYTKRGELAKAAADFQVALERSRSPKQLQLKLADLYQRMGDSAMAEEFREAAEKGK